MSARDEQIKLTATYLNGLAIAIFAVGGLAPIVALVFNTSRPGDLTLPGAFIALCFVSSIALHLMARQALERLDTDELG